MTEDNNGFYWRAKGLSGLIGLLLVASVPFVLGLLVGLNIK